MKSKNLSKKLVAYFAYATLFLSGSNEISQAATPMNFTLMRGYLIVIPVTVNGAEPMPFLLDTGASTTLLTPEFARRLKLRPLGRVETVTVAGTQVLLRAKVETMILGKQTARGLEVLVSDLREVRTVAPQVAGVIGQNFLAQFNFLLDYRTRQLWFEERAELETSLSGERLGLETHEGRWFVSANDCPRPGRYVADSAVASLFLFTHPRQIAELDFEPTTSSIGQARTDAGFRPVEQRRLRSFHLGTTRFTSLPVSLMPLEKAGDGRIEEGLFPTILCRRIYFNHRARYLILNPRA